MQTDINPWTRPWISLEFLEFWNSKTKDFMDYKLKHTIHKTVSSGKSYPLGAILMDNDVNKDEMVSGY